MTTASVYKITSPVGKVYIGQTWNVKRRFQEYHSINHCIKQTKLHRSFVKYGVENHQFSILHQLPNDVNQNVLNAYETYYWQQYKDTSHKVLNLREPGSNGKWSEESLAKRTASRKKLIYSPLSEEHKAKLRIASAKRVRKPHTEESKKKMSESKKGKVSWHKDKPKSNEHKQKLSLIMKVIAKNRNRNGLQQVS